MRDVNVARRYDKLPPLRLTLMTLAVRALCFFSSNIKSPTLDMSQGRVKAHPSVLVKKARILGTDTVPRLSSMYDHHPVSCHALLDVYQDSLHFTSLPDMKVEAFTQPPQPRWITPRSEVRFRRRSPRQRTHAPSDTFPFVLC